MSWIKTIKYEDAIGSLKNIYNRVKGPDNNVDNVLMIHSLRPHSLKGHMQLYKNVLHHKNNTLPKWYLECLGVYVSQLNKCNYCVEHHKVGLRKCLEDDEKFFVLEKELAGETDLNCLTEREQKGVEHAKKLTLNLHDVEESDIQNLRAIGFSDGEILEINQVVSYFNYVNRTVVGLGVNTKDDIIGLSPGDNDDDGNWSHT